MLLTLALGSNQGNSHEILAAARARVQSELGPLVAASAVHRTPAWGLAGQPDFLNQIIAVDLSAWLSAQPDYDAAANPYPGPAVLHRLLDTTQTIEFDLGRRRKIHWGPRTCDLDLIFLADTLYEDDRLSLPHPWWAVRDFVGGIIERELSDLPLSLPHATHRT